jgi:hypothetical protein
MKRFRRLGVVFIVFVSSALAGLAVAGAEASAPSPWRYPPNGRDPLVPPRALYAGQDLPAIRVTLIGVDSRHRDQPLAVVRVDSRPPVRRVVRRGDRIGGYRIVRIGSRSVEVGVPGLGGLSVIELSVNDSSSFQR